MIETCSPLLKDEEIKVVLVDSSDQCLGYQDKLMAHRQGYLHRAFSVILYNPEGKMLIQRRAFSKYHSPGLWANTCCGHPLPEESVQEAAQRRLREELGFTCELYFRTPVLYFLKLDHHMFEHEYVHVFEAKIPANTDFRPNPDEVMEVQWIFPRQAQQTVKKNPHLYTRWFRLYLLKYFAKVFK